MKKYTILTYIFNGYEKLREIGEVDPDVEYILVTDDKTLKSNTWKIVVDESLPKKSPLDTCYAVRFNIFKYATTDICMYLDSNIQINKTPTKLFEEFEAGQYDMSMMPHPLNNTFVPEFHNWMRFRNYPRSQAQKFVDMLNASHYHGDYKGLFQGCYKIVRRGKLNSDFENMTMAFLKYLGDENAIERIDQTVYSYVLNVFFNNIKIMPVSEQILRSSYMTWYWHNSDRKNLNFFMTPGKPDMKFVFNKEVECMQLL